MITVKEHLARILAATLPLPAETLPLATAAGHYLADDIVTRLPVPPWDNSAMDGYAVRFEDLDRAEADFPVALRVVADLPAGTGLRPEVGPGEAARIMTGAPIPDGIDTVIPVEQTDAGIDVVRIKSRPEAGRHIRRAGEDKQLGDPVLPAGSLLTPEAISSLASTGHGRVKVHRRPRIAVIATGDELIDAGVEPKYGQIPDSNSLLVAGLAARAGATVVAARQAGDTVAALEAAIEDSRDADLIVITGGVSVGVHDPVKLLFAGGDQVQFDRVNMQPGKRQAFGRLPEGPLIFGLPGNPVSVWISFQVFVKPCLRALAGSSTVSDQSLPATVGDGWRAREDQNQFVPVVIEAGLSGRQVWPASAGGSGSHLVGSLARANGYAIVPIGIGRVEAGRSVETVLTGS